MKGRRCDLCKIDVQRASCAEHLRSEKHLEKENEKNGIPEWLFQEPIGNKIELIYNPKSLKQIARNNIELDDKQLKVELY